MRYLLVDAHSVIFAWPELRNLHGRRNALAREELIRRLTFFQDCSDYKVVAVFDGTGSRTSSQNEAAGIQVFYSSARQTADSVIERLVAKYGQTHEMTVVTNDLMERQTASTFGASTASVDNFLDWYAAIERDTARQLRKLKAKR